MIIKEKKSSKKSLAGLCIETIPAANLITGLEEKKMIIVKNF